MIIERRGFTLVELLVVIAIIAILAAILMPAMNAALKKAAMAQAQTEVKSVEAAAKAYFNEYSRFPHIPTTMPNDYSYSYNTGNQSDDNVNLMNVLRSIASPNGNLNFINNMRKIVFLEVSENSLANGSFVDPWGTNEASQYRITLDTDFDNVCEPPSSIGNVTNRSVIVWSAGPDGQVNTADDVTSWK